MQFEKFTTKAQEALQQAQTEAHERSHQELDAEHLLLALARQSDSLIPSVLQKLGVALPKFNGDVEAALGRRIQVKGTSSADLFPSPASTNRPAPSHNKNNRSFFR